MRAAYSLEWVRYGRDPQRPWVARIHGHDPTYGWDREFMRGLTDWTDANKRGTRGVRLRWFLGPGVYEACRHGSPYGRRKDEWRGYLMVNPSGQIEEIEDDDVEAHLSARRRYVGRDVLTAARSRVARIFDDFGRIYVSFSGGKDSGVLLEMAADEARARRRRIGVLFIDLEAQYKLTIEYIEETLQRHADVIDPYWVALPLNLRNAVSQFEPEWMCWDPSREADWVRRPPKVAITGEEHFSFFRRRMEFENFTPAFAHWYSGEQEEATACLVGIRTQESLNRWRTIAAGRKTMFDGLPWTTWTGGATFNAYPIYDWRTEDIWTFYGRERRPYNRIYDRMHQAGLTIHQMRICQPYGDDQRKGLNLYHAIEPETWRRVVARVNGANMGALYAGKSGNILGNVKIAKPESITWEEFVERLLMSMPEKTADHYRDKIAVFLRWYAERGYPDGIPDEGPPNEKGTPSWTRICKVLLRNDYWCKGLSFAPTNLESYQRHLLDGINQAQTVRDCQALLGEGGQLPFPPAGPLSFSTVRRAS